MSKYYEIIHNKSYYHELFDPFLNNTIPHRTVYEKDGIEIWELPFGKYALVSDKEFEVYDTFERAFHVLGVRELIKKIDGGT